MRHLFETTTLAAVAGLCYYRDAIVGYDDQRENESNDDGGCIGYLPK